jgi:hypothetical protein
MKTLRPILGTLALVLIAGAAQAQQAQVSATVPFAFVAGDRLYPAGEYYFSSASLTNSIIQVSNSDRVPAANIFSHACMQLAPPEQTKLVFHQVEGLYYLSQIWLAGNPWGREFTRSQTEVRLAENHSDVKTVIVAANLTH